MVDIVRYNDSLNDDTWAMICFSIEKNTFFFLTYTHRLLRKEELSERVKDKKVQNKLLKENDTSGQGTDVTYRDQSVAEGKERKR